MYYNPFHIPNYPPFPAFPVYWSNPSELRTYPPVDVTLFSKSVKSSRLLMEQGSILLDRLGDPGFSRKLMTAAQQGAKIEVDQLLKSIGLRVPVRAKYTPSGINFELATPPENHTNPVSCCTLTIAMRWGR